MFYQSPQLYLISLLQCKFHLIKIKVWLSRSLDCGVINYNQVCSVVVETTIVVTILIQSKFFFSRIIILLNFPGVSKTIHPQGGRYESQHTQSFKVRSRMSGVCVHVCFWCWRRGELHDFSTGLETTKQIFMLTKVTMICSIFYFPYTQQFPNTFKTFIIIYYK